MSEPLTAALIQPKHCAFFLSVERSNKRQKMRKATEEKVADAAVPLLKEEETPQKPREENPLRETNLSTDVTVMVWKKSTETILLSSPIGLWSQETSSLIA